MSSTTTNYNLVKPDGTDYYDVEVFNENAEKVDAALKDLDDSKADLSGGDISDMIASTIGAPTAEYPEFSAGASLKVILGRIKKFLADLKANAITALSASGTTVTYTKADGTTGTFNTQDTTYSNATASAAGLMSAADKSKLNGIESGAQVNTVTGVKGNAETDYRTGQVNITPANIGAANISHASADTTFGLGNQSAYGHVKLANNLTTSAYAAGLALSAYQGYLLNKKITDLQSLVDDQVVSTSWTWGGSFDSSTSYANVWRSGQVVTVCFGAHPIAAIAAATTRQILTNLPAANNRVYFAASWVTYNNDVPAAVTPVMCAIRPDSNANILQIDKDINPTAVGAHGTLFGTFSYVASD